MGMNKIRKEREAFSGQVMKLIKQYKKKTKDEVSLIVYGDSKLGKMLKVIYKG